MVESLMGLSPVVEPAGRGRIFMGMDGLERLHGSPSRQVRITLQALCQLFPGPLVAATRVGRASGKFGAWVAAARAGPGKPVLVPDPKLPSFLASCPVSVLPVDPLMIQRLERLGIATLEKLISLPEPALVGQFGPEGRRALEWARGQRVDPVRPLHQPRPIRVSLDFPSRKSAGSLCLVTHLRASVGVGSLSGTGCHLRGSPLSGRGDAANPLAGFGARG
jgi:hypothetical protein